MTALSIREARAEDVRAIVGLHEEDALGSQGDRWSEESRPAYEAAFREIAASGANVLYVAESGGRIVGTFQITYIPNLTGRGTRRGKIESVKVAADRRSQGIGAAMMAFAEEEARKRGVGLLELTSNATRRDAHRFYLRNGWQQSHAGFKKRL